jgi:hypothetical protein
MAKNKALALLSVRSPSGKVIEAKLAALQADGMSIQTSTGSLATKLEKETDRSKEYLVNLTCGIRKTQDGKCWVASVLRVDFVEEDGRLVKSVDNGPLPATADKLILELNQPSVEILIDDKRLPPRDAKDGGPIEIPVSDGEHEIEVRKSGFETYKRTLTVAAGAVERLKVNLTPDIPAPVAVEEVFADSKKYVGKTVVFDRAKLSGQVKGPDKIGNCRLIVHSQKGLLIERDAQDERTFGVYAKEELAALLREEMSAQSDYTVKLICRIEPWTNNATKSVFRWARVHQLAFYGPDGKVRKTISDPTSKLLP